MEQAQSKSFDAPDERREFPNGEVRMVRLGDVGIGIGRLKPGWSFESSMKHLVGADSCPFRHVGYAISGSMVVRMNDGAEIRIEAGEAYVIPSGHQAAVDGDKDFVGLEFDTGALADFGKQQ